ncbi:MAG TPA: cupin domain-containing protein [Ilumatobacteraceae bacterium]|nr:cupin domain-containing protein [Ilumatobacteraceae bacterium]
MSSLIPIVRNAGEGDRQVFAGGGIHLWKLMAEDTEGAFFLFEDTMGKGKTTPLHLHPEAHEMTYVVDGEIEVQADGVRSRIRSGGMSFVPKGVAHAFIVLSAEARLISIQSPGAVGQAFYRGASDPVADVAVDVVDIPRLQASAADNPRGIKLLGPPPFVTAAAS